MKPRLKKLQDQVIVITGASSGIGLATAKMAAQRGARVVLSSRDEVDLQKAVDEIRAAGGQAVHAVADVADAAAVRAVAEVAQREFGGLDTWVNNAGVSMYGTIEQVPLEDARQLFETNYWGLVNGSLAALPYLKRGGGALINVGSVLSDTPIPLQGHYSASKHAVKGFTDTLRMELEKEGAPVSVTLIQPAAINTPYPEHAANHMGVEPKATPPVYAPELVAKAILDSAQHPRRDVPVGGSASVFTFTEAVAPRAGDKFKEATQFGGQQSDEPPRDDSTLWHPRPGDGRVNGRYEGRVIQSSPLTAARVNARGLLLGGLALGLGLALARGAGRR